MATAVLREPKAKPPRFQIDLDEADRLRDESLRGFLPRGM